MSTKSQTAHDKSLLNLAHAVAYAYRNNSATAIQNLAAKWLSDWVDFQGKEYLEDADTSWYEKRIELLLGMLTSSRNKREAQSLLKTLAQNIDSYAQSVAHCPSGFFSKDIDERTSNILDGVILL